MNKILLPSIFIIYFFLSNTNLYSQNFWQPLYAPMGDELNHIKIDPSNNIYVICNYRSSSAKCLRSTDGGYSWFDFGLPGTSNIAFDSNGYYYIIVSASPYKVYRSIDGGQNWTVIYNQYYNALIEVDSQNNIFMVQDDDLFKSTDFGNNWSRKLDFTGTINSLYISNQNHIYVCSGSPAGLFRSIDGGETFVQLNDFSSTNNVAVDHQNHIYLYSNCYIYKSTDDGQNWVNMWHPNCQLKDIFITLDNTVYATVRGLGVYRSTDGGLTWNLINSGLVNLQTYGLGLNNDGLLFVSTNGDGVYVSINPLSSMDSEPFQVSNTFILEQNYPNPFNPTTKIKYNIPGYTFVNLSVYDVLGNKIVTLANELKSSGTYEVEFDGTGYPSGFYFCQLKAGSFVEVKKMILIK